MRRWLLVLVLLVAACGGGGGDDDDVSTDEAGGADTPKATLGIITTEIETALGAKPFAEASEGQQLDVGDRVRTDTTGFAEITYHDGSWQRVEAEATLTILALSADDTVNTVRTGHDIGRTWNNVRELDDPDDTYEVRTPVATAAVRGTRFATDCPTDDTCTFTVLDGSLRITPTTGDPFTLTAGNALTITDDGPQGDPVDADTDDPWITKNQDLDNRRDGGDEPVQPDDGDSFLTDVNACQVFSAEEATFLVDQRDDGRSTGGLRQDEDRQGEGEVVSSICSWSPIEQQATLDEDFVLVGSVELEVSEASSFESCSESLRSPMTSSGEPLPGVGDEAVWYAEDRAVVAIRGRHCIVLRHDRSDAGTAGRTAFADAAQRILTRIAEPVVLGM